MLSLANNKNTELVTALMLGNVASIQEGYIDDIRDGVDANAMAYKDIAISSVNIGNSVIIFEGAAFSTNSSGLFVLNPPSYEHLGFATIHLTSSTNLRITFSPLGGANGRITGRWKLIELD
jgi:hypothetical protein